MNNDAPFNSYETTLDFIIIVFGKNTAFGLLHFYSNGRPTKQPPKSVRCSVLILEQNTSVDWLLNYQGGSFMFKYQSLFEKECKIRGVSYQVIADIQSTNILREVASPEVNQDVVKLEKAPKIAVYSPKSKLPWDDAVTLALSYAEIPYDLVYDDEVLQGLLPTYDYCTYIRRFYRSIW